MKTSRFFAGLLIVILGIAIFLSNFDVLSLNWHFIFKLWPVLLVFGGISVLVQDNKWRAVLYAVTCVLVLVWILSAASVGSGAFHRLFHGDARNVHSQEFVQDFQKGIRHGSLKFNAGAGTFSMGDTTSDLFRAMAQTNIGGYSLDVSRDGSTENLDFSYEGKDEHWDFGSSKNSVDVKLNPAVDWDLTVDVGACSTDFDLTRYVVKNLQLKAGASSLKIRLGDLADTSSVDINTGASSVVLYVPSSVGCRVYDHAELSSKSFEDLVKDSDGRYHSANYEEAKKKVFVDIDAGVSSIKIRRY